MSNMDLRASMEYAAKKIKVNQIFHSPVPPRASSNPNTFHAQTSHAISHSTSASTTTTPFTTPATTTKTSKARLEQAGEEEHGDKNT